MPMDRLDRMLALVKKSIPDLRLVHKDEVPWMRTLSRGLSPIVPDFQTRFTTVIGSTVYLPAPLQALRRDDLAETLGHEFVHQLDQKRWGPAFYLSYVLAGPTGRTARAYWERRAYAVDLMIANEASERELLRVRKFIIGLFAGPSYAWMWAGSESAAAFLEPVVQRIRDGSLQKEAPYDAILKAWRG